MRKFAPLAVSAIALLALAGCSGGGDSSSPESGGNAGAESSQTVAEACAIAEEKLTAAQDALTESMTGAAGGDESASSDLISTVTGALEEALADISNSEVKAVVEPMTADFKVIGEYLEKVSAAGSDPAKITELAESSGAELDEANTRLQESSTQLQELCA